MHRAGPRTPVGTGAWTPAHRVGALRHSRPTCSRRDFMSGMLRVPRSRGALSGALLILLGLWGGLVAFVGPYFDFAYTPDDPWVFTADRLWMQIAPAAATVLGGLIVLISANRVVAMLGAGLAAAGGLWFIVGGPLSRLWTDTAAGAVGVPVGDELRQVTEQLAFFLGVGALIVFFAALAMGRFAVLGVKEAHLLETTGTEAVPHGRHERREPAEPQPEWAASSTRPMEQPLAPAGSFAAPPAGPAAPSSGPQRPVTGAQPPASGPAPQPMSRPPAAAPPPVPAGPPSGYDPSAAGRF